MKALVSSLLTLLSVVVIIPLVAWAQGVTPRYLTARAASLLYAPIASPTFTGTVTLPSGSQVGASSNGSLYAGLIQPGNTNGGLSLYGRKNAGDSGSEVTVNTNVTRTAGNILALANQSQMLAVDIAGRILQTGVTFANLGTPANGALTYCSDCTIAATCADSGTGAFAKRLNGAWICN